MTKQNLTTSPQEAASRLLDGDLQLEQTSLSQLDQDKFARYAQIGDVMRQTQTGGINIDITASVASALENEPCHNLSDDGNSLDEEHVNDTKVVKLSAWRRPLSQIAIAASVALVAVVGVNTMPQQTSPAIDEMPVLQSRPLAGGVAPVSFSSEQPALQQAEQGIRDLQQQRIGALVLEHQRQSRVAYALQQKSKAEREQLEEKK
ncbi:anti-sigma-E factor RseA [Pseudoalteromonas sp. A25]|uniref:sigma-E factor negative regulatory protein n=1 Tax=Pseudoalteromonas sp. A25 TaxID=116092 RepID=UPI0012607396|nr:anti sigma-E factor RseA C-terminal domain-containing protein [Pseudoalteromonas sp. A25]BBN82153.1 anti-sigma-E factor RseA [Pseudoalteromonas sp. A25]